MDRDTVRLILLIAGAVILVGIYLWGRFRSRTNKDGSSAGDTEVTDLSEGESDEDFDSGVDDFHDGVRVIPPRSEQRHTPQGHGNRERIEEGEEDHDFPDADVAGEEPELEAESEGAPFLIQVSVIAGPGRAFQGRELKQALLDADLLFGDMGIFHRFNQDLTQTLFSVASLVEPGTFPIDDMDDFECPGIVLFFQTARVTDPLATYDDLVNTSRELAHQLHGIQWDETRQALSASKIARMRNLLKHAPQH